MSSRINAVRPMRAIGVTAAAVVAISLPIPVVASAAGATTIYACVNKKSGAVRIVSAKAKCKRTEHKLSWGSTGPAGPAGVTGATINHHLPCPAPSEVRLPEILPRAAAPAAPGGRGESGPAPDLVRLAWE